MAIRGFAPRITRDEAARVSPDPSQRAVIDLPDGVHAAVRGAPGTGKTATIIELVAERIDARGYHPDEVVVIAADRRSATSLRDLLSLRVQAPTRGPLARTLGSLAFQILGAQAVAEALPAPRLLTGAEQDLLLAELLRGEIEDEAEAEAAAAAGSASSAGSGPSAGSAWPPTLDAEVRSLRGFRTELRELMMRLVETETRPADLAELGRAQGRPEWVAAARFISEYERVLDSLGQPGMDAAEVIAEATTLIREGRARLPRLLVVDDFHEQGPAALGFLRAAAAAGTTVLAFADPDVASATFRGSDPGAISRLGGLLGGEAAALTLGEVHRHGPELRRVVAQITERIGAAGMVDHRAAVSAAGAPAPAEQPVLRIAGTSPAAEQQAIARVLREHHLFGGVPWSRMAIIVRSSASIPVLARALALADVPTTFTSGTASLRERFAARQLVQAVAVAIGRLEPEPALYTDLLTGPLAGLDGIGLRRLRRALRHEELLGGGTRDSDQLLVEALAAPERLVTLDSAVARRAARFARSLAEVRTQHTEGASAEELLWTVWSRSGLAESWAAQAGGVGLAAEEANRNLDAVMAVFTAAKRAVERDPDAPAEGFIDAVLGAELGEDSLAPSARSESVWIGTPNAVIGAEYEIVVVARLQAGAWPNMQLRGALVYPQLFSQVRAGLPVAHLDARAELLSDELRMFALAASRARRQIVFSATDSEGEQPSPLLRFSTIAEAPVRENGGEYPLSLRGLVGALRRRLVGAQAALHGERGRLGAAQRDNARAEAEGASAALARLAEAGIPGAAPASWYGLLELSTTAPLVDLDDPEAPDARVRVSPSRVETFEKSPLHWFIEDIAATPSGLAAGIGTVVHDALERVGEIPSAALTPEDVAVERLWEHVNERWSELRFEAPWLGERERGNAEEMLRGVSDYLLRTIADGTTLISAEGAFRLDVGRVTVSGKIDRVERRANGEVVILDLKTGRRTPTRAELPRNAQLAAYQLALSEGVIEGTAPEDRSGGAALLYVRTATATSFAEFVQEPQDDAARAEFVERLDRVGRGMAAAEFLGVFGSREQDPLSQFGYRIHLIAAVSE